MAGGGGTRGRDSPALPSLLKPAIAPVALIAVPLIADPVTDAAANLFETSSSAQWCDDVREPGTRAGDAGAGGACGRSR